jgi:uncharacterized protein (TIGR03437 family)
MCPVDTAKIRRRLGFSSSAAIMLAFLAGNAAGQSAIPQPDWRRVGGTVVEAGLASPVGGPVDRVWYSTDGSRLFARTSTGKFFVTNDFETWQSAAPSTVPALEFSGSIRLPEPNARIQAVPGTRTLYAIGRAIYRSEDNGANWLNLTQFRGASLLGDGLDDLAVAPGDPEQIVAAGQFGLWRSADGGRSWTGLNDGLPNLPIRRILRVPGNGSPARIELASGGALFEAEWNTSQRGAWVLTLNAIGPAERQVRTALGAAFESRVTAFATASDFVYAGGEQGRMWVSSDRGRTWRSARPTDGMVESIWINTSDPRIALAAIAPNSADGRGVRVIRTINGGVFWDELTADLPPGAAHGIAADIATGAVYVGTDAGVFLTYADLLAAGPATAWTPLKGKLPAGPVRDVRLGEDGHQLWAAVEGHGLFAALAPHRFRDPRVVNAADYSARPAAPGSLLSVIGGRVSRATSGPLELPVLSATDTESQIQVPFEAAGSSLRLALLAAAADGSITRREVALALSATSPAIFVDKDGTPMILDADRGVMLDAATPARAGSRIQILATGLGRVTPDWPTGLAAPLDSPPRVIAPLRVLLDRAPVEVTSATLAPGYVGFYLIEVQLPEVVNAGPAELYIETAGQSSGRVSLLLTQ